MALPYPTRVVGGIKKVSYLFYFLFLFHYPIPTSSAPSASPADKYVKKVRLWIECADLEDRDLLSKSDPLCQVTEHRGPSENKEVRF